MRILDLFCGAGGASMGYHQAGFEVVGVDINPQPNYPFEFHQLDAIEVLRTLCFGYEETGLRLPELDQSARIARGERWVTEWTGFDAIHASPPCQAYSDLQKQNKIEYPELIRPIRELLQSTGKPYVIENVEGAPLIDPITLCGTMFPILRVIRHRLFESNVDLEQPEHTKKHPLVFTYDKRKAHYGKLDQNKSFVQVTGGGNCTVANKRDAMQVPWMTGSEANEAIPPAYTEYIGRQLLAK